MTKIHVQVTQEDINKGSRGDYYQCPIARAIKRCGWESAYVEAGCIRSRRNKPSVVADLPDDAQEFIRVFDECGEGEPFEFDVEWK